MWVSLCACTNVVIINNKLPTVRSRYWSYQWHSFKFRDPLINIVIRSPGDHNHVTSHQNTSVKYTSITNLSLRQQHQDLKHVTDNCSSKLLMSFLIHTRLSNGNIRRLTSAELVFKCTQCSSCTKLACGLIYISPNLSLPFFPLLFPPLPIPFPTWGSGTAIWCSVVHIGSKNLTVSISHV